VRRYEYDILGRLVREYDELNSPSHPTNNKHTAYAYDALGRVLTVTNALGHTDTFTYDALGRIKTVKDRKNNITTYYYDANGNIIETKDALGHSSYFGYDPMNMNIF